LTKPTEQYLWLSLERYGFDWLWRPGVIVMGILLLASIVWIVRHRLSGNNSAAEESGDDAVLLGKLPSVLFTILVLAVSAAALYQAQDFPYLAAIFPMAATIPAIFMAAAQIVLDVRATPEAPGVEIRKKTKLAFGYFLSLVAYLLLILFFGFGIATALFTFAFLYAWVRAGWFTAAVYTGVLVGVTLVMSWLLGMYWPEGILIG